MSLVYQELTWIGFSFIIGNVPSPGCSGSVLGFIVLCFPPVWPHALTWAETQDLTLGNAQ